VLGIAVVVALLSGLAWVVLCPHEPLYRGRPVRFWLEEADNNGNFDREGVTTPAELALRELGTNAVPMLLKMAGTSFTDFRRGIGQNARREPMRYLHLPPQLYKEDMVAWGFKVIGPAARPAVPALSRMLSSTNLDVPWKAVGCLAAIGPEAKDAVPDLIKVLQTHKSGKAADVRFCAQVARTLGEIGPAAGAAIPSLVNETNLEAIVALVQIRGGSFEPFFQRLRDTSNPDEWKKVASQLSRLGPKAEPAVPMLLSALAYTNDTVTNTYVQIKHPIQNEAICLLGQIHRRPDLCLPALTPLLHSLDDNTRGPALSALGAFRTDARSASVEVVRLLKDRVDWIRFDATNVLRAIDPEAAARAGIKPDTHDPTPHR
jgi:hypothetical protein